MLNEEIITHSAILYNGEIFLGKRHPNCIRSIIDIKHVPKVEARHPQGFYTNKGRFLDREEAAELALANGQCKKLKFNSKELFSEDLW